MKHKWDPEFGKPDGAGARESLEEFAPDRSEDDSRNTFLDIVFITAETAFFVVMHLRIIPSFEPNFSAIPPQDLPVLTRFFLSVTDLFNAYPFFYAIVPAGMVAVIRQAPEKLSNRTLNWILFIFLVLLQPVAYLFAVFLPLF